jgi:23S rRNA (adenine2503-C2)-methyltransferase
MLKNRTENKTVLSGMTLPELEEFIISNGEPAFRARQLQFWLYKKHAGDFKSMSNLSKNFRNKLEDIALISDTKIRQKLVSKDGTIKYLLEYPDGNVVETVLMSFEKRPNLTACVSTQVGCAVGCVFCATGKRGFIRNLTAREIVDQILTIQRDTGLTVTNLVYMGQGEPLLNYDETTKSINIINSELEIGIRRITVSTSGIVPKIYELTEMNRQLVLALSLHAPDHELRKKLIPIEEKYPVDEVIKAMKHYAEKTGRRVTIEYTLIDGVNDSPEQAEKVNKLLKGLKYNINLIPYNPVCGDSFKKPSIGRVNRFKSVLEKVERKVTVRLERGTDIAAACGQLAGQVLDS